MATDIRRLGPDDAPAYRALRLRALWEFPQAFTSSHEEDEKAPLEATVKRLASPRAPGSLQMLLVEIEPDSGSGEQGYSHAGEECGIVMEGILDLWIDGERRTLGTGDSFRFPSTKLHRFHNPGSVMARVVWVTSPPLY